MRAGSPRPSRPWSSPGCADRPLRPDRTPIAVPTRPPAVLRSLRSRGLIGGNLLLLLAGMTVDGMLVTLTAYLQQALGRSAAQFGLMTAVMTVTAAAGALLSRRILPRLGPRRVAAAGTALLGAACLLLTRTPADSSPGLLAAGTRPIGGPIRADDSGDDRDGGRRRPAEPGSCPASAHDGRLPPAPPCSVPPVCSSPAHPPTAPPVCSRPHCSCSARARAPPRSALRLPH
ncbi:MFS transporter [Kitasatospora sp. NPDC048407]|uniref:MFS transporter n=1 Tax=Kitasatospora sp. NPDC048407 TaxID=3364051 RepID=UPI003714CD74